MVFLKSRNACDSIYVRARDVNIRVPPAYAWRHTLVVLHAPYGVK